MNILETITRLERRVASLEKNRGSSLRFCTVTESNKVGSARVQLHDGDEMVSMPVRTLHRRTLKDQDLCLPDVGEQVAVLFEGQGLEEGCILGAVYSKADPAPGQEQHMEFYKFSDGTIISYDRENNKLYALIKGAAEICIEKEAHITVQEKATVNIQGEATVLVDEDASIRSKKKLKLQGDLGISLRGPSISWDDLNEGGQCEVEINAHIKHKGQLDRIGNESLQGNLSQTGNQNISGSIDASGKISGNPVTGCNC